MPVECNELGIQNIYLNGFMYNWFAGTFCLVAKLNYCIIFITLCSKIMLCNYRLIAFKKIAPCCQIPYTLFCSNL